MIRACLITDKTSPVSALPYSTFKRLLKPVTSKAPLISAFAPLTVTSGSSFSSMICCDVSSILSPAEDRYDNFVKSNTTALASLIDSLTAASSSGGLVDRSLKLGSCYGVQPSFQLKCQNAVLNSLIDSHIIQYSFTSCSERRRRRWWFP